MKIIFNHIRQLISARPRIANSLAMAMIFALSANAFALRPFGVYRFDAISGTVLDKETRKPIEGVVVVGHWGLEKDTLMNSDYSGPLVVKETLTDKNGKFMLPASMATDVHKHWHFDSKLYPEIAFFKGGYDFTVYRHNGMKPLRPNEVYSTLKEDEYTLPMWSTNIDVQLDRLLKVFLPFGLTNNPTVCPDYESLTPLLLKALRAERERISGIDKKLAGYFASTYNLMSMEGCITDNNKRNGKLP